MCPMNLQFPVFRKLRKKLTLGAYFLSINYMKDNKPNINILKGRRIAIIGYGSQGQAQALNMRDSGYPPIIGLPTKSKSRKIARKDGFSIVSPHKAIFNSEIIIVLIPDHKHKELFEQISAKNITGKAFIFAHGLSVAFGLVKLPKTCDIILVAPHGPGIRIRELYQKGLQFTSFWAVENDVSGNANKIARAYATAIGCPPAGLFKSTFKDEAIGDIFGEQAVLCGGLVGLLESGFMTLVKNGLSAENAYLECVYQLDLIIGLIKEHGPAGMFERISKTAAFGSLKNKDVLFDRASIRRMQKLYDGVRSGRFAKSLMAENKKGMKNLAKMLKLMKNSPLQKTHEKLKPKLR
jgi:ketol-acid reductoisomerase